MTTGTLAGILAILVSGVCLTALLSALMLSGRISQEERTHGMD
jgi:hypothetical protein